MRKEILENTRLELVYDENDWVPSDQIMEGLGVLKGAYDTFVFTKTPKERTNGRRNPRLYNGSVVHSSLRKDGQYGICMCLNPTENWDVQCLLARKELKDCLEKLEAMM